MPAADAASCAFVVGALAVGAAGAGAYEHRTAAARHVAPATSTTVDCSQRSQARFPKAYDRRHNFVVGPLSLVGGADAGRLSLDELGKQGKAFKMPLLLRVGHTASVSIPGAARRLARLDYVPRTASGTAFGELPTSMRFLACDSGKQAGSDADGRPVTFWSGAVAFRRVPLCVPLAIRIDGGRPSRRWLSLAHGRCP